MSSGRGKRNSLMIVRAGTRSLHQQWLDGDPARTWDICVCPYQEISSQLSEDVPTSDVMPGQKWTGLATLFDVWDGWREYEYITLADDDLFVMPGTWSRFFERAAHYGAQLAAPALSQDSVASHPVTVRHDGCDARRTTFVEIMMPTFRVDVLAKLLPTFAETKTGLGWGLDYVWPALLHYQGIFVIDSTPVIHWRPSAYTTEAATDGHADMTRIMAHYGATAREETLEIFG